jgi:general secretion pathway protein E
VSEVNAYSYCLNEEKRNWLGFELKPKSQLIQFLQERGYEASENAKVLGRSQAKHTFDILATRDIGVLTHHIAIGIGIAATKVELHKMFEFDDKAYDCGINYKVLIAIPGITAEAERFADRQRIKVLDLNELKALLARDTSPSSVQEVEDEMGRERFKFKSKSGMINYLQIRGYEVKQYAKAKGRSEVEHTFDFLATRDDDIVVHNIAIGIEVAVEPIGIEKVFNFDEKAYDCGILDKVLVAVPGLTKEAKRFAQSQRIEVFEAKALEPEE